MNYLYYRALALRLRRVLESFPACVSFGYDFSLCGLWIVHPIQCEMHSGELQAVHHMYICIHMMYFILNGLRTIHPLYIFTIYFVLGGLQVIHSCIHDTSLLDGLLVVHSLYIFIMYHILGGL